MTTTEAYTLSLHDALPILVVRPELDALTVMLKLPVGVWLFVTIVSVDVLCPFAGGVTGFGEKTVPASTRSEEHTSELQSQFHLVCCRLLDNTKYVVL